MAHMPIPASIDMLIDKMLCPPEVFEAIDVTAALLRNLKILWEVSDDIAENQLFSLIATIRCLYLETADKHARLCSALTQRRNALKGFLAENLEG